MAQLLDLSTGQVHDLVAEHTVGRSRRTRLCIRAEHVSGHHALVRWTGDVWQVRDLGSRNGTWVGDARLGASEHRALDVDDEVAFGDPEHRFRLVDDAAPVALGRCGDRVVRATDGVLVLPDEADPAVFVHWDDSADSWVAERPDGSTTPVEDGDTVDAPDAWELSLPAPVGVTAAIGAPGTAGLAFRVSDDQERVDLWVTEGERERVPERVHHYALYVLAKQRVTDREAGRPPPECGWLYSDDLAKQLGINTYRLNLYVFRARKQMAAYPAFTEVDVVERRRTSQQLRLGVARISIAD